MEDEKIIFEIDSDNEIADLCELLRVYQEKALIKQAECVALSVNINEQITNEQQKVWEEIKEILFKKEIIARDIDFNEDFELVADVVNRHILLVDMKKAEEKPPATGETPASKGFQVTLNFENQIKDEHKKELSDILKDTLEIFMISKGYKSPRVAE